MLVVLLFLVSIAFGVQGFILEEVSGSKGFGISKEIKQRVYITKDAYIVETEREFTVQKVESGKPKIYRVFKSTKSYADLSKSAPLFLVSLPFLECEERVCRVNRNNFKPLSEFREIRNFNARKVIVRTRFGHGEKEIVQWYTKEWKELVEANRLENEFYLNFIKAIMNEKNLTEKEVPLKDIGAFLNELTEKLGGVIRTEQKASLFDTYREVLSVRKGEIPDYIYRIPEGYKEIPMR